MFNDLQEHPTAKLAAWAEKEPTEFYKIAAKLIPTEVTTTVKTVFQVTLDEDKPDDHITDIQHEEVEDAEG